MAAAADTAAENLVVSAEHIASAAEKVAAEFADSAQENIAAKLADIAEHMQPLQHLIVVRQKNFEVAAVAGTAAVAVAGTAEHIAAEHMAALPADQLAD